MNRLIDLTFIAFAVASILGAILTIAIHLPLFFGDDRMALLLIEVLLP